MKGGQNKKIKSVIVEIERKTTIFLAQSYFFQIEAININPTIDKYGFEEDKMKPTVKTKIIKQGTIWFSFPLTLFTDSITNSF